MVISSGSCTQNWDLILEQGVALCVCKERKDQTPQRLEKRIP